MIPGVPSVVMALSVDILMSVVALGMKVDISEVTRMKVTKSTVVPIKEVVMHAPQKAKNDCQNC